MLNDEATKIYNLGNLWNGDFGVNPFPRPNVIDDMDFMLNQIADEIWYELELLTQ